MDQLSIDYAQEALREFGIYGTRATDALLVLRPDGSGRIEAGRLTIPFSDMGQLVEILQKKNGAVHTT